MGGEGSGISLHARRLMAVDTAHAREWAVGTVLASSAWKSPRTIVELTAKRVRLRCLTNGTEFVRSFPLDVAVHTPAEK
jgi:hypothetical protein